MPSKYAKLVHNYTHGIAPTGLSWSLFRLVELKEQGCYQSFIISSLWVMVNMTRKSQPLMIHYRGVTFHLTFSHRAKLDYKYSPDSEFLKNSPSWRQAEPLSASVAVYSKPRHHVIARANKTFI